MVNEKKVTPNELIGKVADKILSGSLDVAFMAEYIIDGVSEGRMISSSFKRVADAIGKDGLCPNAIFKKEEMQEFVDLYEELFPLVLAFGILKYVVKHDNKNEIQEEVVAWVAENMTGKTEASKEFANSIKNSAALICDKAALIEKFIGDMKSKCGFTSATSENLITDKQCETLEETSEDTASEVEVDSEEIKIHDEAETIESVVAEEKKTENVSGADSESLKLPDFSTMSVKDIKRWAVNKDNKLLRDLAIKNGALPVKVCAMKDRDLEIWMKKKKSSPSIEGKSEEKKDIKKPLVNEDMRYPDLELDPVASAVIATYPVPITEKNPEKMRRYCEHLHNIAEWALNEMRYSSFNTRYAPLFGVMLEGENAFVDENNFSLSEVFAEYDGITCRYKNSADYAKEGKFFQNVRIDVRNGEYFVVVNGTETKLVPCAA